MGGRGIVVGEMKWQTNSTPPRGLSSLSPPPTDVGRERAGRGISLGGSERNLDYRANFWRSRDADSLSRRERPGRGGRNPRGPF